MVEQANLIGQLTEAVSDCDIEVVKLALSQMDLDDTFVKAILTAKGLEGAQLEEALSTATMDAANKKATLSTSSLKAAMAGLNATLAANPIFAVGILVASVLAGTKIIEGLTTSFEEQEEIVNNLSSEIDGLQQKYDTLKEKDNRTEQEEDYLSYLERELEVKKELYKEERRLLALKDLQGYNDPTSNGNLSEDTYSSTAMGGLNKNDVLSTSIKMNLDDLEKARKEYTEGRQKYLDTFGQDKIKQYDDKFAKEESRIIENLNKQYTQAKEQWEAAFKDYDKIKGYIDEGVFEGDEKTYWDNELKKRQEDMDSLQSYIDSLELTLGIKIEFDLQSAKDTLAQKFGKNAISTLSDEDIKIASTLDLSEIDNINQLIEAIKKAKKEADEPIEVKTDVKSTIEAVEKLSGGFYKLSAIYADIRNKGDFDYSSLIDKDFVEIFGSYKEEYQNFIDTVSKSPTDINACQSAFDNLVTALIKGSGILDIVTEENKSLIATMLEAQGVGNASAIVDYALAKSKEEAFFKTNDLTNASTDEINALIAEAKAAGLSESAIYKLRLALITANDSKLDFSQQIEAIKNMGLQAGVTAAQISAMNAVANANAQVKMYASGTARRLTNSGKVKDSELAGMSKQLTAQAQATVAKQAAKEMYAAIADIASQPIDFPTGNYTPKSPSGSGSKGSGGGSSSKDPYVADIDKYKDLTDAVDEVESKIKQLNQVYDHTDSLAGQIALKDKLIGLYKEEQDALTALNNARDKEISQKVKELRSVGFKIEYDPKTDKLQIKNREHLNSLSQDTIQKYEKILKATEDLNDANKESAEKWTELTYAIADVGKEITELRIKQYDSFVRDKEHLLDLLGNRKDTIGMDLSVYDDLMKGTLRTWQYLVKDGYEKNKEQIQDLEKTWMDYYDARIEREKEILEKQLDDHDKALDAVLDFIDDQLDGLDDQIDALKKINEERREALELQKAQIALDKARNQKTRKVLRKGKGYVYEADEDAIREAEENIAEKQYEASVKQLENQKENLEELKKVWSEIPDLFEKYQNELLASQILGANWEQKILDGREDTYEDFKDAYFDLQEEIQNKSDELENHMNQSYINMVEIFRKMADLYGNMNNISGKSWYVNKDGKAPSQAQKGDIIYTKGGTYQITNKDENGKFTSTKLDDKSTDIKDGMWGTLASNSNAQLSKAIGSNTLSNQNIVDAANDQIDSIYESITGMEVVGKYLANNTYFTQEEINTLAKHMGITDLNTGAMNTNVIATDANTDSQNENTDSLNNATDAIDNLSVAVTNMAYAQAEADAYNTANNMKEGVSNEKWLKYWDDVLNFSDRTGLLTQEEVNNALAQRNRYQELVNQEKAVQDMINGVTGSTIKVDLSEEDKRIIASLQDSYNIAKAAGNEQGMELAHQLAEAVRNGFDISPITSKPDYKLSDTTYTGGASAGTGKKSNLQKDYEWQLSKAKEFGASKDYISRLENAIARETWGSGSKIDTYTDEFGRKSTIINAADPSELKMSEDELKNRYDAGWRPVNDGMDKLGGNLKETNDTLSDNSDAMYDSSDKIDSSADKIVDSNNNVADKLDSLENAIGNANFGSGDAGSTGSTGGSKVSYSSSGGTRTETTYKSDGGKTVRSSTGRTTTVTTYNKDGSVKSSYTTTSARAQVKKKAKGGRNLVEDIYNVDEYGKKELLIQPTTGRLVHLSSGSDVIPADVTKNLWDFGENPMQYMESTLKRLNNNLSVGSVGGVVNEYYINTVEVNGVNDVEGILKGIESKMQSLPNKAKQFVAIR